MQHPDVHPPPDRHDVIREAARLFNRFGYTGTSVTDVLKATGLRKKRFYSHFKTKEALALEAFDFAADLTHQRFVDAVDAHADSPGQLLALVEAFADLVANPPLPGGCAVLHTALSGEHVYPELRRRAQAMLNTWRGLVRRIARRGIRHGEIHPRTRPEELASLLVSTMEGAVLLSSVCANPVHVRRAADHLTAYIGENVRV